MLRGEGARAGARARIEAIERTVKHDVIAFLTHVEELAGPDARWLHRGMTSSDVLDSALAMLLTEASDLLLARADRAAGRARPPGARARADADDRAEPRHLRRAGHLRARAGRAPRGDRARQAGRASRGPARRSPWGRSQAPSGTYAHLSPAIEARALATLGLRPETVSTQVVARDRHASFFASLALLAGGIERLATNVRHWQRSEVGEAEEAFTAGQKGSSAMPHKRNPILSENLCGLARVVRSAVIPALEDVALWHERDISHSSVERMIAPDATATLGYMLDRAAALVDRLVVYPERLLANLDRARGAVLLGGGAPRAGRGRNGKARRVRRGAEERDARLGGGRRLPRQPPRGRGGDGPALGGRAVGACFDLDHALAHVPGIVERALGPATISPAATRA